MRAWVRADRHMDTCSDIPIVAKAGQESSDPIFSKEKAGDSWEWPGCVCPKVFQKDLHTVSDHVSYFFYFINND